MKVHRLCGESRDQPGSGRPNLSNAFSNSNPRSAALRGAGANPRHICLTEGGDRLTFTVPGEDRQEQ